METTPTTPRRGIGVRAAFALAAFVIVAATAVGGYVASRRTGELAREQARDAALSVAQRAAAGISVGMENAVQILDGVGTNSGAAKLVSVPPGPDTEAACRAGLGALTGQGFSLLLTNDAGETVCTATTGYNDATEEAAVDSVKRWLTRGDTWDRLGWEIAPLVDGRMALGSPELPGAAVVAVPVPGGRLAAWQDAWRSFVPPLDSATVTPGTRAALLVSNEGRAVISARKRVEGLPSTVLARPEDGVRIADPVPDSKVYQDLRELQPGSPTGITPSTARRGGPATSEGSGNWVTAPIPRLPAHVAVAYDDAQADALENQVLRYGLGTAAVLLVVTVAVLAALAGFVGTPLVRLRDAVRESRAGGGFTGPRGGPSEVREVAAEVGSLAGLKDQIGEVAAAARERERVRVVRLLNGRVSEHLATAGMLLESDPEGASSQIDAAQRRLREVTSELDPVALPAGGVGAALAAWAAELQRDTPGECPLHVTDTSAGARLGTSEERLVYRAVLEACNAVWESSPADVRVTVATAPDAGLEVTVEVPDGPPCVPLGDEHYYDRHEFTSYGGLAVRQADAGVRRLVLRTRPAHERT